MGRRARTRRAAEPAPVSTAVAVAQPAPGAWLSGHGWLLPASAVGLAAGALFLCTLAPTATLVDSGELILVAHEWGVAHPPGVPLYTLVAHLFTRLAWGNIAQRVHLASALPAALACAALVWMMREAWLLLPATPAARRAPGPGEAPPGAAWPPWVSATALAVPGLLLAGGRTLWSYATVAEVYALHTLGGTLALALTLRLRHAPSPWTWLAWALTLAAGLALHHVSLLVMAPALAVGVAPAWRQAWRRTPRVPLLALAAGASCLAALYATLPWAAARGPSLAWGDPSNAQRLWWHVTARQYRAFLAPSADSVAREAAAFLELLWREHGAWLSLPVLALALAGAWDLTRRAAHLGLMCALVVLGNAGYGCLYTIAEDKDAYLLPTRVVLALLAGLGGLLTLARWAGAAGGRLRAGALLLLVPPLGAVALNRPYCDRSSERVAEEYFRDLTAELPAAALLLTADWQAYAPTLYFRDLEGRRTDVAFVDLSLLRRSWYFAALEQRFPALLRRLELPLREFLEDLRAWEQHPRLYERDLALNRRINERFQRLVLAFVEAQHQAGAAVFATQEAVLPPVSPDPAVAEALTRRYTLVPRGLVFELRRERGFVPLAPLALDPRGLFPGVRRFASDDVVALKVRPVYLSMVTNRARYLAAAGDTTGARQALRRVLAWQPDYAPARTLDSSLPR